MPTSWIRPMVAIWPTRSSVLTTIILPTARSEMMTNGKKNVPIRNTDDEDAGVERLSCLQAGAATWWRRWAHDRDRPRTDMPLGAQARRQIQDPTTARHDVAARYSGGKMSKNNCRKCKRNRDEFELLAWYELARLERRVNELFKEACDRVISDPKDWDEE